MTAGRMGFIWQVVSQLFPLKAACISHPLWQVVSQLFPLKEACISQTSFEEMILRNMECSMSRLYLNSSTCALLGGLAQMSKRQKLN